MTIYSKAKPAGTPTWCDLMTPDIDAARSFYRAVFGWDYDIGAPEFGGYTTARSGQHSTAGLMGMQPDMPPMPSAWGMYFATDDIDADVARAVELGAQIMSPAMVVGEFGSMAICIDPGGAMFGFWQAGQHIGAQVTDEPGATTWYELYAPDAKMARDFYAALLGATAEPMPGDMEYYALKHGDEMLCGIMQLDPSWGELPPHWAIYFSVADADDAVATIVAHGGTAMSAVEDTPYGRMASVADPFGATFKILQLPMR